jgi:hypothetical protein
VRERIEYRFRVPSTTVFTLYSYSKVLEYPLEYPLRVVLLAQLVALGLAPEGSSRGRED